MLQGVGGRVLRSFDPGDSSSGTAERGGNLPLLRIGAMGWSASCGIASRSFSFVCGLLFFELAQRQATPRSDVRSSKSPTSSVRKYTPGATLGQPRTA